MKTNLTIDKLLILVIIISLLSCKYAPKEAKKTEFKENSKKEFFLKGNWVYHDSAKFELLEINDTNDVHFYTYTNRKKETGLDVTDSFYKSEAKISVFSAKNSWLEKCGLFVFQPEDRVISIQTDKYRFDYVVKKDSLIEFDKTGIRKRLVRQHPERD